MFARVAYGTGMPLLGHAKRLVRHAAADAVLGARRRAGSDRRVLLYHRIEPVPRVADDWSVATSRFVRQLELIIASRYSVVGLDRVLEWPTSGSRRELLLAFDDGYRSILEHAAPELARRGLPFACFLVTGALGGTSTWERAFGLAPSPLLSAADLPVLRDAGAAFGSHSVTHRDLSNASDDVIDDEVRGSRRALADESPVFSVPFGHDDPRILPALQRHGYSAKITNQLARLERNGGLLTIPCTAVLQGDDDIEFQRKLHGAYDWLNPYYRRRYARSRRPREDED